MAINYGLIDPNAAFRGTQQVNELFDAAMTRRAGRHLAEGDTDAAMQTFQRNGLLGQAQNLEQQQWARENREIAATGRAREEEDRQRQIQLAEEAREAQVLGTLATNLQQVLQNQGAAAVLPAFDAAAQTFMTQGARPEQVQQLRAFIEQDPEAALTTIAGTSREALRRYQFSTAGGAMLRADNLTGNVDVVHQGPLILNRGQVAYDRSGAAPSDTGGSPLSATTATEAIQEMFPGVRVTGGDRLDEEHNRRVGGAPNSWHRQEGRAVDIAPIEGETVQSVAQRFRDAGWTVHEALDETRQTSGTGPHWHFAVEPPRQGGGTVETASVGGGLRELARGQEFPETRGRSQWRTMSPQEVEAAGLRPGTVAQINQDGQIATRQSPPASSSSGSGNQRVSVQDQVQLRQWRTDAAQVRNMQQMLDEFASLNREADTGGFLAVPGAARALAAVDARYARMMSIVDRLTPAMRNGLPGAASDRDVRMFRGATVGVEKPREANMAIVRAAQAFSQRQGDFIAFMENWAQRNGTLLGGYEQWDRYLAANPLFDEDSRGMIRTLETVPWRRWFRDDDAGTSAQPTTSPRRMRFNPETGRVE